MADVCSCDVILGNTGEPGCKKSYQVANYLILTALVGSTGTENTYDVSAGEPTLATIQADLNAADSRDRIYPVGEFEDVENLREDSIFQEFGSGKKVKVRDGFKTFTGFVPNSDPILIGKIKKSACSKIGAYIVDTAGNFIFSARKSEGIVSTAYPIEIDNDTVDVKYVEPTDTTIGGMMISFQWKSTEKDSYLRQVTGSDLDWTPSDLDGLIDVNSVNSGISTTTVTVQLVTDYGDAVEGLVTGDFALNELSPSPGPVAGVVVVEQAANPGTYDITFTAETLGDVIEIVITKTGFDFTKVRSNTFTI